MGNMLKFSNCIIISAFIFFLTPQTKAICSEVMLPAQTSEQYATEDVINSNSTSQQDNSKPEDINISQPEPGTECNLPIDQNIRKEDLPEKELKIYNLNNETQQTEDTITPNSEIKIEEVSPDTDNRNEQPDYKPNEEPSLEQEEDLTPELYNNTKNWIQEPTTENPLTTIDRRKHIRYDAAKLKVPVKIKTTENIEDLIDISRGGIAIKYSNTINSGDIIPIHISYKDIEIKTNIKIISVNNARAGAEFIENDKAVVNQLLYMNVQIEADNNMLATKLSQ